VTPIRWTDQAIADLEAIREYVARDSAHYAALLVERLFASMEYVEHFPEIGRIVPEYQRQELREIIQGSYRVVYHLVPDGAEVLTVFHGARLFPAAVADAL
jgi:plasmid stabilization system protein ParE